MRKLVALGFLAVVLASPAQAASVGDVSAPSWCEDLGLACNASVFVDKLRTEDPNSFLPRELADYVLDCQRALQAGDLARLAQLKETQNPLAKVIHGLLFVPKKVLRFSELPASGARLVADCDGKHVQLREDRRVLKNALRNVLALSAQPAYPHVRGQGYSARSAEVIVETCDIGGAAVPRLAQACLMSRWGQHISATFIPRAFVTARCFPAKHGYVLE